MLVPLLAVAMYSKAQGSLVNEGNPVLLGHVCLAVAEPVAHHGHLGLVDLHAGGEVHLRHRVGEALLVPHTWECLSQMFSGFSWKKGHPFWVG